MLSTCHDELLYLGGGGFREVHRDFQKVHICQRSVVVGILKPAVKVQSLPVAWHVRMHAPLSPEKLVQIEVQTISLA